MQRFISLSIALVCVGLTQADLLLNTARDQPIILAGTNTTTTQVNGTQSGNSTAANSTQPSNTTNASSNATSKNLSVKIQDVSDDLKRLNCYLYDDLTVFDITSLENGTAPYSQGNWSVSFCRPIDNNGSKGYVFNRSTNVVQSTVRPTNIQTVPQSDDSEPATHLTFDQVSAQVCPTQQDKNVTVSYEVFCDAAVTVVNVSVDQTNACNPKVSLTHKSGCPVFQATSIVQWLSTHGWVIGVVMIAFGALTNFFGGKYIPYVISFVAGSVTFTAVLVIASVTGALSALNTGSKPSGGAIALAVFVFILALGLAILVGWFIKKIQRIGITLLGAAAGFLGGFLLYSLVFAQWLTSVYLLAATVFVAVVVVAFLTWRYQRLLIVYLSGFIGAYSFVRGISLFAGSFPNEFALYGQLSSGVFTGLEWQFYVYLASIVILGIIGVVFQIKKGYHEFHADHEDLYHKA